MISITKTTLIIIYHINSFYFKDFSVLMNNYHQTLEAEESKDENEEDTSKLLDEIVRTISTQSLGDCPSITDDDDDKKEMNGVAKGRG